MRRGPARWSTVTSTRETGKLQREGPRNPRTPMRGPPLAVRCLSVAWMNCRCSRAWRCSLQTSTRCLRVGLDLLFSAGSRQQGRALERSIWSFSKSNRFPRPRWPWRSCRRVEKHQQRKLREWNSPHPTIPLNPPLGHPRWLPRLLRLWRRKSAFAADRALWTSMLGLLDSPENSIPSPEICWSPACRGVECRPSPTLLSLKRTPFSRLGEFRGSTRMKRRSAQPKL
mmetsp:Transcript_13345/g.38799  ORF Transcript_13345/g.38799 Transcript_13345/m.38799 type:complete len:227 (-) Transcript_13345:603-1283(-)